MCDRHFPDFCVPGRLQHVPCVSAAAKAVEHAERLHSSLSSRTLCRPKPSRLWYWLFRYRGCSEFLCLPAGQAVEVQAAMPKTLLLT